MLSEKVRDVIVETLGCEAEAVTPEASLEEDLGADSLAFVELVIALEDATGIHIEEAQDGGRRAGLSRVQTTVSPVSVRGSLWQRTFRKESS